MARKKRLWTVTHSRGQAVIRSVSKEGALRQARNRGYKKIKVRR